MRLSSRRSTRADGIHSRETILNAAARLATVEGLEGMSIGRLADHIGMSKSGIYAHFGSKEELQIATVETADQIFEAEVVQQADEDDEPLTQLEVLCDAYLAHLEGGVFPGGCFFISAAAEFDTHPGPVLDRVNETLTRWMDRLVALLTEAQSRGTLRADQDPPQLAWELDAFLLMGNLGWVMSKDAAVLLRAREAIRTRLSAARVEPGRPAARRPAGTGRKGTSTRAT